MIKNYKQLNITSIRKKALDIINAGLESLDIQKVIKGQVSLNKDILNIKSEKGESREYNLNNFSNIFVVAIGKGSSDAADEIEKIIGNKITKGIALDIKKKNLKFIKSFKGTHPLPSAKNSKATKKVIKLLKNTKSDDLVIVLIFGGGSALFCQPAKISIKKLKKYTDKLIKSGKDIYSTNTVRKHLSLVKGGNLAKLAYPAKVVSCIFSDVPKNDFAFIASGPTVKDKTTIEDAQAIGAEFNWPKDIFVKTPKEEKYFKNTENILFFSNQRPLQKMKKTAEELGFNTEIYSYSIKGEATKVGNKLLKLIQDKKGQQVLLAGGETTVIVRGNGIGGRNQELVLGALSSLKNNEIILSISSDGWDNTKAAGAIGDIKTKEKAQKLNLDLKKFLKNNNSFNFFKKTNDLIFIDQGINISDLIIVAKLD